MSEVRLSPTACRNILSTEIANLSKPKPAAVARVAALPAVSEYAKRLGYVPLVVRVRLPRPA